jgi:hypothetical protein
VAHGRVGLAARGVRSGRGVALGSLRRGGRGGRGAGAGTAVQVQRAQATGAEGDAALAALANEVFDEN